MNDSSVHLFPHLHKEETLLHICRLTGSSAAGGSGSRRVANCCLDWLMARDFLGRGPSAGRVRGWRLRQCPGLHPLPPRTVLEAAQRPSFSTTATGQQTTAYQGTPRGDGARRSLNCWLYTCLSAQYDWYENGFRESYAFRHIKNRPTAILWADWLIGV